MPNSSFRVAFWALLISVGLCVVAASTNTRDARLALSYPTKTLATPDSTLLAGPSAPPVDLGQGQDFPPENSSPEIAGRMASLDPFSIGPPTTANSADSRQRIAEPIKPLVTPGPAMAQTAPEARHSNVVVPDPYERSPLDPIEPQLTAERPTVAATPPAADSTPPVDALPPWSGTPKAQAAPPRARIASADPEQSFGEFPAWAQAEAHGVYEELPPPPLKNSASTNTERESVAAAEEAKLDSLRRELAALRATQEALDETIEPSGPVSDDAASPRLPETYGPVPARLVPGIESPLRPLKPEPVAVVTPARQPIRTTPSVSRNGVSISEGSESGRWNLQFDHANVPDVLMSVGEMIGWQVVIEPDVSGEFTGTFTEADLEQCFAVVVKSHRLRVERRGDYILIGTRPQLEAY